MLAKIKLNSIKVLISKTLIDSYISHYKFVSVYNVLKRHYDMREKIKKLKTSTVKYFKLFIKQCYLIVWSVQKIQKLKNQGLKRQQTEK